MQAFFGQVQTFMDQALVNVLTMSSVWSVVARALLWFLIAGVIIISVDNPRTATVHRTVKRNLGMFLLIVVVGTALCYLLFSFTSRSQG